MLLFEDIVRAEQKVSKHTVTTPVVHSQALSKAIGERIYLKLENQHVSEILREICKTLATFPSKSI